MTTPNKIDYANRTLVENRRARAKYTVEELMEVGVVLVGSEVKSIRAAKIEVADAWVHVSSQGQLHLLNAYVAPYTFATAYKHEPKRVRTLLAHRKEITKLEAKIKAKGFTVIPMRVYLKEGRIKIELGLCKGKDGADRRQEIKERESIRETRAVLKARNQ
ncbi:MAG: SsrA-binding protein SmpB [Deltaproteobacteria bacterium]|nr:SsrA-binding protein SmpB [Deltaproteobacteria bacterium]